MTLELLSEKKYCYISIYRIYGAKCRCNSFFVFRLLSINAPIKYIHYFVKRFQNFDFFL